MTRAAAAAAAAIPAAAGSAMLAVLSWRTYSSKSS
jgi:hypothetical protein